jgi:hypothetical protein
MKTFETKTDLFQYLEENKEAINNANVEKCGPLLAPVFASEVTNDPMVMMEVHKWLDLETDANFGYVMRSNQKLLRDAKLNLYKFKILCEYRGPLDEEQFLDGTVREKPQDEYVMEAAKHPDFPEDGREIMYAIHKTVDYLSPEAQDMFIF